MSIRIVTDSTCDLPPAIIDEYKITVIPLYINIGEESYLDGVEITRKEFYTKLPTFQNFPTTSAPGTGTFIEVYKKLADEGAQEIISIHISAGLSNTHNVASLAAQSVDFANVNVMDSGQLTIGTGLIVLEAAKAAKQGKTITEILDLIEDLRKHAFSFAALDTMKYLRKSGRISHLQYGVGAILDIKPIMLMHDGEVKMELSRTQRRAHKRIIDLVKELGPLRNLALVHTHTMQTAEVLHNQHRNLFPENSDPYFQDVTPVIGSHIGPGAVCFTGITANKTEWPDSIH